MSPFWTSFCVVAVIPSSADFVLTLNTVSKRVGVLFVYVMGFPLRVREGLLFYW